MCQSDIKVLPLLRFLAKQTNWQSFCCKASTSKCRIDMKLNPFNKNKNRIDMDPMKITYIKKNKKEKWHKKKS